MKQTSKEMYEQLDRLHLCHRCQKARQAPNRKFCFDCLDKIREYNAKAYDPEKAHEYQSRRREIYQTKKENGLCVRCSKPATHGLYCYECSIKVKRHQIRTAERRKRERHERGLIPQIRIENNLCMRCGKPLDIEESKLCSVCVEENRKYGALADKTKLRNIEKRCSKLQKNEESINDG